MNNLINYTNGEIKLKVSVENDTIWLAENAGYGFDKMIDGWNTYSPQPIEFTTDSDTSLTTYYLETAQKNTKDKILELLKQNQKYTKAELMQVLDKADGTIKEHMANLKKEGKIKRIGSTKSGYREVIDAK